MRQVVGIACLLSFLVVSSAFAAEDPDAGQFAPAAAREASNLEVIYRKEIMEAQHLGMALYNHDQAALLATDFIFAKIRKRDRSNLRGWIEDPKENGDIRVIFFSNIDDAYTPSYSVDVSDGVLREESFKKYADGDAFSPNQLAAVLAREFALQQKFQTCSKNYNTATVPDGAGGFYVYLLAATFDAKEIIVGGHYRFHMTPDGKTQIGFKKYTNSCLVIPKNPPTTRGETVAAFVTHLLSPYPSEIHVFITLQHGTPLYVMTVENKAIWSVNDGVIKLTKN